jgi:hypothetical protein
MEGVVRPRIVILATILTLLVIHPAGAEWVSVSSGVPQDGDVRVIEDQNERIVLSFEFGGYDTEEIWIEGRAYVRIRVPNMAPSLKKGEPSLPIWAKSVIIPDRGRVIAQVVDATWEEIPSLPVEPSKGNLYRNVDPATVPYTFDPAYEQDTWSPSSQIALSDPFILRDFRGVTVMIHPIQYNAMRGVVRIWRSMTVEVTTTGSGGVNEKTTVRNGVSREFLSLYEGMFINLESYRHEISEKAGNMLVIAADLGYENIGEFMKWKEEKGIDTKLVHYPSETGGSGATAVHNCIQSHYDTDGVTFILLVGDLQHIPSLSFAGGEADPMYTLLEGGDVYPDAFISRFSYQDNGDLQTQAERSIGYERFALPGNHWYTKACGIASNEGSPPDWQWMDGFRAKLLAYNYDEMDRIYDPGASSADVTNALNDGRSLVLYMGHGGVTGWSTTGFSNSNVNALANAWKLPLVSCVACSNGDFSYTTCFGEAWLWATHNGEPSGAIACYASSIGQSWVPPQYGQEGLVDSLVNDRYNTTGGVTFMGSVAMLEHYGGGYAAQEMFNTWILFGDCSVQMRTDVPIYMTVDPPAQIGIGQEVVEVSVPGVQDALCGISMNGEFRGSAYTDAAGNASITLTEPFDAPGTAYLVVTAYNRIPYEGTIPVGDGDFEPPTVPGNVTLVVDGTLSWSPSTDNVGVVLYRIYRDTVAYFLVDDRVPTAETTETEYAFPECVGDPAVNYYFVVTAVDAAENESDPSATVGEHDYQLEQ